MKNVPPSNTVDQLEAAMVELRRVMLRAKTQHLAGYNLTPSQAEVLIGLDRQQCSTGNIADALGVTSSAATQTVETLVRRGLIERASDPDDRRVVRLALTPEGHALTNQLSQLRRQQLAELVSRLTSAQTDALVSAIKIYAELINHHTA